MCTSADEEPSSAAADVSGDASGSAAGSVTIPEVISTAPRIGLSQEAIDKIDWGDVATLSAIGALTGASSGALGPTLIGALGSAAGTIETQDDVDLSDLFEITNDLIMVPGVPVPYTPLF